MLYGYLVLTNKKKIAQVIVVEGKDDTTNLKRFYDVKTYETRGSAISEEDLERIKKLHDLYGVIVFTDPDYNGERIRKIIMQAIPEVQHAFLNRDEATPKSKTRGRSLGIEHAHFEDLERALSKVYGEQHKSFSSDVMQKDLIRLGLIMGKESRKRREYLGDSLRIGYCNGKQLAKRLSLFQISLSTVESCMKMYEENQRIK